MQIVKEGSRLARPPYEPTSSDEIIRSLIKEKKRSRLARCGRSRPLPRDPREGPNSLLCKQCLC
jgi:hypothetical protein